MKFMSPKQQFQQQNMQNKAPAMLQVKADCESFFFF